MGFRESIDKTAEIATFHCERLNAPSSTIEPDYRARSTRLALPSCWSSPFPREESSWDDDMILGSRLDRCPYRRFRRTERQPRIKRKRKERATKGNENRESERSHATIQDRNAQRDCRTVSLLLASRNKKQSTTAAARKPTPTTTTTMIDRCSCRAASAVVANHRSWRSVRGSARVTRREETGN